VKRLLLKGLRGPIKASMVGLPKGDNITRYAVLSGRDADSRYG